MLLSAAVALPAAARDIVVDHGDAAGPGSLRSAIAEANQSPGPDRIVFAPGVSSIRLDSWLLTVTEPLEIDGRRASGPVEIVAPDRPWPPGLQFSGRSDGSLLRGLRLSGFATAVEFDGCDACRIEGVQIDKGAAPRSGRIGISIRNSRDVVVAADVQVQDVLIGVYCEHSPHMNLGNAQVQAEVIAVEDSQCSVAARGTANAP
jgi:hypothetical protein